MLAKIRNMLRLEDNWQVRCPSCGRTKDISEFGYTRIAIPIRKWTLGWCSQCRRLRFLTLEPMEETK